MNNLQLIEGLCNQIEIQNEIIKHLATRLAEISALTEETIFYKGIMPSERI